MRNLLSYSTTALASIVSIIGSAPTTNAQYFKSVDEAFNPGEQRGSFDMIMKPYPIPAETTTYVDFVFNFPDDLPDLFHVTFGEVINSQPEHLHHFAVLGCPEKIDPSLENTPLDDGFSDLGCMVVLGGWAPGADVFGNTDLDTGMLFGRGIGYKSLQLNLHYTDGVYVDEAKTTLKMATDGIRIHYTPVFRPYSSVSKQLINVVSAPEQLAVPPGESRFFVSRTCTVDTPCKDANEETMGFLAFILGMGDRDDDGESSEGDAASSPFGDMDLTCEVVKPFCNLGEEMGSYVRRLCPVTCGLCGDATTNEASFSPEFYRVTAVWYHAHLLGREMYTTLIRGNGIDDASSVAPPDTSSTIITPKQAPLTQDLQSREFWIFDNQETIPLDFDVVRDDTILRGTEIQAGDKIQTTCVFDSTDRTEDTFFHLSTYDEMCANSIRVTFETPDSLLNNSGGGIEQALDIATQLHLMTFACEDGPAADVYSGVLTADEDARDIWKDHPIEDTEGCTFPASDFFSGALTREIHNCDIDYDSDSEEESIESSFDVDDPDSDEEEGKSYDYTDDNMGSNDRANRPVDYDDNKMGSNDPPAAADVESFASGCHGATTVLSAVSAWIVVLVTMLW